MRHGADLSTYQRNVDYAALAAAVDFAYVKCCDAEIRSGLWVPFEDEMHRTHVPSLRSKSTPTGDYCFCHPSMDVAALVDFFLARAYFDQLRLVLDLEALSRDADGVRHVPANAGAWARIAFDRIASQTGTRAIGYAGKFYAETMLRQEPALAYEDFWIAAYPGTTVEPTTMPNVVGLAPARILAWQWTGTGSLPGITGNADRDVTPDLGPLLVPDPQ